MRRADAIQRTRAAIEAAALDLFLRDGYEATHVTHVAEAAGVSRRTVFRHFPRKEDLVFSSAREDTPALAAMIREQPGELHAVAALERALVQWSAGHDRDVTAKQLRVIGTHPLLLGRAAMLRDEWVTAVAGALADRGADGPRQARALAGVISTIFGEALVRWSLEGEGDDPALADVLREVLAELHGYVPA